MIKKNAILNIKFSQQKIMITGLGKIFRLHDCKRVNIDVWSYSSTPGTTEVTLDQLII